MLIISKGLTKKSKEEDEKEKESKTGNAPSKGSGKFG